MTPDLGRLVIYTRRIDDMAAFYETHFGYTAHQVEGDRIVELRPPGSGLSLLLHPLGKGQNEGQVLVKLVFDVPDVAAFHAEAAARGLDFGKIHKMSGYAFANAKDPAKNSIQISSRAFQ